MLTFLCLLAVVAGLYLLGLRYAPAPVREQLAAAGWPEWIGALVLLTLISFLVAF